MWVRFLALLILASATLLAGQEVVFQPGHLNSILAVKFSPDGSQLISFSSSHMSDDDRLCLWDVPSGRLLWMTKTGFVQRRYEYCNLTAFDWSEDGRFIVTKSINGSYQTWDVKTGKIISLSEADPGIPLATTRPPAGSRDAATSNDGRLMAEAVGWRGPVINITDTRAGRSWRLSAHPNVINSVAYTPDGSILAAAGSDGSIYLFDAARRILIRVLPGHTRPVTRICFSPDGSRLFSCDEGNSLKLWGVARGQILAEDWAGGVAFRVEKTAWSPDAKTLLTVRNDEIGLWNAETLTPLRRLKVMEEYRSSSGNIMLGSDTVPVHTALFSRDGTRILASYADNTLRTWDIRTGRQVRRLRLAAPVNSFCLFPGEKTILAAAHGTQKRLLKILDARNGQEIVAFDDQKMGDIQECAISPDGKHVAAALAEPYVLIWRVDNSKPCHVLDIPRDGFSAIAFSPDGRTLAAGGENQNVMLFDVETGARLWQLIPFYEPSNLENRLAEERKERHVSLDAYRARRDERAAAETPVFEKQVYITFEHYGEMINPGMLRFSETGNLDKGQVRTSAAAANAVWLRLHNDSPLPIELLASEPYLAATKCEHQFEKGNIIYGLCPDKEVSFCLNFEDKNGKDVPPFYDNSFIIYLLPKTSVLFAVPLRNLESGKKIRLNYSFQNVIEKDSYWTLRGLYADYGTKKTLKFGLADIPKSGALPAEGHPAR